MKKIIVTITFLVSQIIVSQTPNWNWVKKSSGDINEAVASVATDSNGNIYAAGSIISGNANFGLGALNNNGYADYFIVKYSASGTPLWVKNGGGAGNEIVYNVATDSNNNLYALVSFQSASITFGSYTLNNTATIPDITGLLTYDLALVKYDSNGTVLWAKKVGGPGDESLTNLVCDASGNVLISTISTSQTFSTDNLSVSATSNNLVGGVVAKIQPNGNSSWIKRFGNDNNSYGPFISGPVFDASGNFYLTGRFNTETYTLGATTYNNVEPGLNDSFIAKFDSNGTILWQKALQGNGDDYFGKIVLIQNELYVVFTINALPSIGSSTYSYDGINYNNQGLSIGGLIKMNDSGQVNNFLNIPNLNDVLVTDGTDLYFTGGTTTSSPPQNIYLTKMNSAGQVLWSKTQTGSNSFSILGLTIDQSGNIIFGGYFDTSNLNLDTITLTNTSLSGYIDAVVAKLNSTSLSNVDFEKDRIEVFPNPTKDLITIYTDAEIKQVTLVDLNGRILDVQNQTTLNLINLIPGIYILYIETENGVSSRKIIKK